MTESKVLLFIVEGPSDEASLAPALEQIVTGSTKEQKQEDSIYFADNYDDPEKFASFFNGSNIKIEGTYPETWSYAQIELNSLKRGSNFWICIDGYKKNS